MGNVPNIFYDGSGLTDEAKQPYPKGVPSYADVLDGATVKILSNNFGFLRDPGNGYLNADQPPESADTFRIDVINSSEFILTHIRTNQPVFVYSYNNESMVTGALYSGTQGERVFYLTPYPNDISRLNFRATAWPGTAQKIDDASEPFWIRTVVSNRAFGMEDGQFRTTLNNPARRTSIVIYVVEPGPTYKAYQDLMADGRGKAKCCMNKYSDGSSPDALRKSRVCYGLGYTGEGPTCDNYMDNQFCVGNDEDEFCGCTPKSLDNEIKKLPYDVQQYRQVLMAQPLCWSKGCAQKSYRNAIRRASPPVCNNVFCTQIQSTAGSSNINTGISATQTCIGGLIKVDKPLPSPAPTPTPAANSNPNDAPPLSSGVPSTSDTPPTSSVDISGGAVLFPGYSAKTTQMTDTTPVTTPVLGISQTMMWIIFIIFVVVIVSILLAVNYRHKPEVTVPQAT
jgi:hypothetical protein